jgi:hypothetical protein
MPAAPQQSLQSPARAYAPEERADLRPAAEVTAIAERRQAARRGARADRALVLAASALDDAQWLPRHWPYLLLCMTAAVGCSALVAHGVPGNISGPLLTCAVAIASCITFAHRWAHGRGFVSQLAAVLAVVIAPMFLFGLGMTVWTVRQGLPWDIALAALLWVGSIAGTYLRKRPGVMLAAQLAMWSAAVIVHQSAAAGVSLAVAFVVALMVSRDQMHEQRQEEERRQAGERVHTRARDILADYEQTGQGWFWRRWRSTMPSGFRGIGRTCCCA